jgi:hypothetical protein
MRRSIVVHVLLHFKNIIMYFKHIKRKNRYAVINVSEFCEYLVKSQNSRILVFNNAFKNRFKIVAGIFCSSCFITVTWGYQRVVLNVLDTAVRPSSRGTSFVRADPCNQSVVEWN